MNEEGNNTGFFSPLFSGNKNRQSMQPFSTVSTVSSAVETSEERDSARFNTRSSSPISINSTFVNEEGIIHSNSNNITKEQDLYHSSSLKTNDNIYSVEFSPTDNYFNNNNQAQSTSIFTTNTPIMSVGGGGANNLIYSNINNYNPPATPSTIFSINDSNDSNHNSGMDNYSMKMNDKTCNIEIRPDINIRNYNSGGGDDFWKNLWKM
ncbi:2885_t:CDS:2, partial [Dentiscutata erythropus]